MFFKKKKIEEEVVVKVKPLKISQEAKDIWKDISTNDDSRNNWIGLKYKSKRELVMCGNGQGGYVEAKSLLKNEIVFLLIRGAHIILKKVVPIIVVVVWIPEEIEQFERSKASFQVVEITKQFNIKKLSLIFASSTVELNKDTVIKRIRDIARASGKFVIDGSSKEAYVNFVKEKERNQKRSSVKKQKAKNNVFKEIISTEETYVKSLKIFVHDFLKPMSEVSPSLQKQMYSSISTILGINDSFLQKLQRTYNPKTEEDALMIDPSEISKMVDLLVAQCPVFKLYIPYVNQYQNFLSTFTKLMSKDPKFRNFIKTKEKELQSRGVRNSMFTGFLIMPIQRIPRYQLLFRDLLKQTSTTDPNYSKISEGAEKTRELACYMNEKKAEAELSLKTIEIAQKYSKKLKSGLLFENHRKMRKFGDAKIDGGEDPAQICVFNDLILICPTTTKKKKKNCVLIDLTDRDVRVHASKSNELVFLIETGRKLFHVKMEKKKSVEEFVEMLQASLNEFLLLSSPNVAVTVSDQFDYCVFESTLTKDGGSKYAASKSRIHELTPDYKMRYFEKTSSGKKIMKGSYSVSEAIVGTGHRGGGRSSPLPQSRVCKFHIKLASNNNKGSVGSGNSKRRSCYNLSTLDIDLMDTWIRILEIYGCGRQDVSDLNERRRYDTLRVEKQEEKIRQKSEAMSQLASHFFDSHEEEGEGEEEDKKDDDDDNIEEEEEEDTKEAEKVEKELELLRKKLEEKNQQFEEGQKSVFKRIEKEKESEKNKFIDQEESDNEFLDESESNDDDDDESGDERKYEYASDDVKLLEKLEGGVILKKTSKNNSKSKKTKKRNSRKRKKKKKSKRARRRPPPSPRTRRRRPPKRDETEKEEVLDDDEKRQHDDLEGLVQTTGEAKRRAEELKERAKRLEALTRKSSVSKKSVVEDQFARKKKLEREEKERRLEEERKKELEREKCEKEEQQRIKMMEKQVYSPPTRQRKSENYNNKTETTTTPGKPPKGVVDDDVSENDLVYLKQLRFEEESIKTKRSKMKEELSKLEKTKEEVTALQTKLQTNRKKNEDDILRLTHLKQEIKRRESEMEAEQQRIDRETKHLVTLRMNCEEQEMKLRNSQRQLNESKKQLVELQQLQAKEKSELVESRKSFEHKMKEEEENLRLLKQEFESAKIKRDAELEELMGSQTLQLQQQRDRMVDEKKKSLELLKTRRLEFEAECDLKRKKMEKEKQELMEERKKILDQLHQQKQQETKTEEVEEEEEENLEKKRKIFESEVVDSYEKKLSLQMSRISEKDEEIKSLEHKISQERENFTKETEILESQREKEIQEAQASLKQEKSRRKKLEEDLKELETKVRRSESKIKQLLEEKSEFEETQKKSTEQLEIKIAQLETEKIDLESEHSKSQSSISLLQNEKTNLETLLERMTREKRSVTETYETKLHNNTTMMTTTINELTDENTKLETELKILTDENTKLQNDLETAITQKSELEEMIIEQKRVMEEKRLLEEKIRQGKRRMSLIQEKTRKRKESKSMMMMKNRVDGNNDDKETPKGDDGKTKTQVKNKKVVQTQQQQQRQHKKGEKVKMAVAKIEQNQQKECCVIL